MHKLRWKHIYRINYTIFLIILDLCIESVESVLNDLFINPADRSWVQLTDSIYKSDLWMNCLGMHSSINHSEMDLFHWIGWIRLNDLFMTDLVQLI